MLLSNALNVALSISVHIQNQIQQYEITPFNFVKGDFESELKALRVCMMIEVQAFLAPFLAFASNYNASKAHKKLALMLDPHFKLLNVMKTFVGWEKVIQMVAKYDNKTLLLLLVVVL